MTNNANERAKNVNKTYKHNINNNANSTNK